MANFNWENHSDYSCITPFFWGVKLFLRAKNGTKNGTRIFADLADARGSEERNEEEKQADEEEIYAAASPAFHIRENPLDPRESAFYSSQRQQRHND